MTARDAPETAQRDTHGRDSHGDEYERRSSPRYVFSAVADLLDRRSGTRMPARVADIGLEGCYVDSLNTFPSGSQVIASIRHAGAEFKTAAMIAYALPSMGMGLRFVETTKEMRAVLSAWIREAQGGYELPFGNEPSAGERSRSRHTDQAVLSQLIELLMQKSLVTETEGAALIEELMREPE